MIAIEITCAIISVCLIKSLLRVNLYDKQSTFLMDHFKFRKWGWCNSDDNHDCLKIGSRGNIAGVRPLFSDCESLQLFLTKPFPPGFQDPELSRSLGTVRWDQSSHRIWWMHSHSLFPILVFFISCWSVTPVISMCLCWLLTYLQSNERITSSFKKR